MIWKINENKQIWKAYTRIIPSLVCIYFGVNFMSQVTNKLRKDDHDLMLIFILVLIAGYFIFTKKVYCIVYEKGQLKIGKINMLGIRQFKDFPLRDIDFKDESTKKYRSLKFFNRSTLIGEITENTFGWERLDINSIQEKMNDEKSLIL